MKSLSTCSFICALGLASGLFALASACSSDPPEPERDRSTGGAGGEPDEGTGGKNDDGGAGGEGGSPSMNGECEEPTGPGTSPTGPITSDTTWTAAGSPYRLPSGLSIQGAKLTLEACTVVLLGEDAWIEVEDGGALVSVGEAIELPDDEILTRPVLFGPENEGEFWGSLSVDGESLLDLTITGLVNGGSAASPGAIHAQGINYELPVISNVRVIAVVIDGAESFGVNLDRYASFTDDSTGLLIRNVDSETGTAEAGFPVRTSLGGLSTLPSGDYTGNEYDAVLVDDGYRFAADLTIHNRGVPYYFSSSLQLDGDDTHSGPFTFTIEAGSELQFAPGTWVELGTSSAVEDPGFYYPVTLIADGTPEAPIVFTSAADTPAAGDWDGIHWQGGTPSGNVFDHVIVAYAGGEAQANGFGCGNTTTNGALVIYSWLPDSAFITNSTFINSAGGGIVSGWDATADHPNLRGTGNTFEGIAADFCEVSQPKVDGACPGGDSEPDCY